MRLSLPLPSSAGHPILALLVDRDPDTRRLYAEHLSLASFDIDEASDGREALAKAIARKPQIVVTETRLPGISGFDLCTLLRRDPSTSNAGIVFVTGDGFPSDVQRAVGAGADAFLVKPCLPDRLLNEINVVLQRILELQSRNHLLRESSASARARAEMASERARSGLEIADAALSHSVHVTRR